MLSLSTSIVPQTFFFFFALARSGGWRSCRGERGQGRRRRTRHNPGPTHSAAPKLVNARTGSPASSRPSTRESTLRPACRPATTPAATLHAARQRRAHEKVHERFFPFSSGDGARHDNKNSCALSISTYAACFRHEKTRAEFVRNSCRLVLFRRNCAWPTAEKATAPQQHRLPVIY